MRRNVLERYSTGGGFHINDWDGRMPPCSADAGTTVLDTWKVYGRHGKLEQERGEMSGRWKVPDDEQADGLRAQA